MSAAWMATWSVAFALCAYCTLVAGAKHVWVVQLDDGGEIAAREIANEHGLEYHGRVPHLRNKFVFKLDDTEESEAVAVDASNGPQGLLSRKRRSITKRESFHRSLELNRMVSWMSYQSNQKRQKRDFMPFEKIRSVNFHDDQRPDPERTDSRTQHAGRGGAPVSSPSSLDSRAVSEFSPAELNQHADKIFRDPLWPKQWYLHDTRSSPDEPKLDFHVIPAWRRNLTGRGVVITVLDDGIERDHPDLRANYDARASYNYNMNTPDPMPRYKDLEDERHGTRCAGQIGMSANNSHCGVGVAFNARLGGVKILDGHVNDLIEARGLSHALDYVDIYSASWGPTDNGQTLEAPGPLASEALQVGTERGRDGKGAIYVWAAGNGGSFGDNCNCDGYASSVYTIAVNSVNQKLVAPWYAEHCSATLASTFSSGARDENKMVSTDLKYKCTTEFTGTSASAPIAAGIIALLLEANPGLTWRDVQHVIVWTTEVAPLLSNGGWQKNAAGHKFHPKFGFGLFNVEAMTRLVEPTKWKTVPEKSVVQLDNWRCSSGWRLRRTKAIKCDLSVPDSVQDRVKYLEHVQLRVKVTYSERGALAIYITSPSGTRSQLLTRREHDKDKGGFPSWAFMTVHFWGENPAGEWTVEIEDQSDSGHHKGVLKQLELILHGTATEPDYRIRAGGFRKYNHDYNNVKNMESERNSTPKTSDVSQRD